MFLIISTVLLTIEAVIIGVFINILLSLVTISVVLILMVYSKFLGSKIKSYQVPIQ